MVPISLHREQGLHPAMPGPQAWVPSLLLWLAPLLLVLVYFLAVEATNASSASQSIKMAKENPILLCLIFKITTLQHQHYPIFHIPSIVFSSFCSHILTSVHFLHMSFILLNPSDIPFIPVCLSVIAQPRPASTEENKFHFRSRCGSVVDLFFLLPPLTIACPSVSFHCLCLGPSILFCLLGL